MIRYLSQLTETQEAELRAAYLERARRYYALTDDLYSRLRQWSEATAARLKGAGADVRDTAAGLIIDVALRYHRAALALKAQYDADHELDLDAAIATDVRCATPTTPKAELPHAASLRAGDLDFARAVAQSDAWRESVRATLARVDAHLAAARAVLVPEGRS